MLKRISPIMLLTVALTVSQLFLSTPANAKPKYQHHYNRGRSRARVVNSTRNVVTPRRSRVATPNKKGGGGRIVRLANGNVRLPNGQVVPSHRLVRLRNQGYWRLPNGDFIQPNQQIVPVKNTVRMQNGHIRLPNGIILII